MKNPTLKISEVVKKLEEMKEKVGDVETFMLNDAEMCFDGIGTLAFLASMDDKNNGVFFVRNDDVIKPRGWDKENVMAYKMK